MSYNNEKSGKDNPSHLRVKVGGSHKKLERQVRAFKAAGMELSTHGAMELGSKFQQGRIPNTPEAIALLRQVGGTIPSMNPRLYVRPVPKSLRPMDVLAVGTRVSVENHGKGTVVKCDVVQGHPSGMIAVHTVELDKGGTWTGNYSFVYLVENQTI